MLSRSKVGCEMVKPRNYGKTRHHCCMAWHVCRPARQGKARTPSISLHLQPEMHMHLKLSSLHATLLPHRLDLRVHLLLLLLLLTSQRLPLGLDTLLSPLTGSLCLCALGVQLVFDDFGALGFGFRFVDLGYCQRTCLSMEPFRLQKIGANRRR